MTAISTEMPEKEFKGKPSDFETAIDATGFGCFNIFLLFVATIGLIGIVFETSVMSYILPSAECDLGLTLLDKGILNAITYAGMIFGAVPWGYIGDRKGRKLSLVVGFLTNAVCVLSSSTSRTVLQLMILKFCSGLSICGPFSALMAYLNEAHGKKHRAPVMMSCGLMMSLAFFVLPMMALTIMPKQHWTFQLFGLTFTPWQIFLMTSALPSLSSGIAFCFFPESPKFLMSQGKNKEALEVFRKIFAINQFKPKGEYKINELVDEVNQSDEKTQSDTISVATIESADSKPSSKSNASSSWRLLFHKPYLGLSLLFYVMNFGLLLGQNSMRLWLPQMFASIHEYELKSGDSSSMCDILEYSLNRTSLMEQDSCEVVITAASYFNNLIVAAVSFCGYVIVSVLVNYISCKWIVFSSSLLTSICSMLMYWSTSSFSTLVMSSLFVTLCSISGTSLVSVTAGVFPTCLRTLIVSLAMMFGRLGALIGNILFPTFMSFGCFPPFLMISLFVLCASVLSLFLSNTKKMTLK